MTFTKEIYNQIQEAVSKLPDAAIERTKGAITKKGYDTTGYGYQWLVNVLNEIVGVPGWSFSYTLVKEVEGTTQAGQPTYTVTVDVTVEILDAKRTCAGGHKATLHADALKGAITNGLKKTLALFGVGKQAYEGTIDDDNTPLPEETPKVVPTRSYSPQNARQEPPAIAASSVESELKAEIVRLVKADISVKVETAPEYQAYVQTKTGYDLVVDNYQNIIDVLSGKKPHLATQEIESIMNSPSTSIAATEMRKGMSKK